jgi:enoyl-CoA hydratase
VGVRVDRRGAVTTVVLSRPEVRNAVDREHALALADAFRAFDEDPAAHAGVLWGEHGVFCAGADLRAIAEGRGNRMDPEGDGPMGPSRLLLSKPVVAAVAGHAVGGGLELALWCDLRVAEEGAQLGFLNRRFGVPLVDGGTVRLPRIVGMGRALDLVLTGRLVDAREALAMGLVDRVVAAGEARTAAEKIAKALAALPPPALRHDRLSVYEQAGLPLEEALRAEFRHGMQAVREGALEGAQRFAAGEGRHGKKADRG